MTLSTNSFSGELPAAWGSPGAFKQLSYLEFSSTGVTGALPAEWGSPHGFQKLQILYCEDSVQLGGTLPESWADPGAFPNLREMVISNTSVSGTIPANWGFPRYFPYLQLLNLGSSNLKGNIPAFNNAALAGLDLNDCKLNGSLGMFWSSSAPLQAVSLSSNHISGSLPDVQGALSELTLLDLSDNQMTGIVALSWLQEGNLVSHVSVLDVGDIWPRSVDLTGWRQQLCLQMDLYDLDVTGQQAKLLPVARHRRVMRTTSITMLMMTLMMSAFLLGISLRDHVPNVVILNRCNTLSVESQLQGKRLRWLGHVFRMPHDRLPKKLLFGEVKGLRPPGRPRPSFNDVALRDCQNCRISRPYRDAQDRLLWRDKTCPART